MEFGKEERRALFDLKPSKQLRHALLRLRGEMRLSKYDLQNIMSVMRKEMTAGLANSETDARKSTLKMLPSFLYSVPNGKEEGEYLALDLGGSNFRVLRLRMTAQGGLASESKKFAIPKEIMTSTHVELFAFIAECVEEFVPFCKTTCEPMKLGFTFSFPVEQLSVKKATLIQWTKGFNVDGVIGNDVVGLLQNAFEARKLNIETVAIVNDTVGTLLAKCRSTTNCVAGLILGTGSNLAYIERSENVLKLPVGHCNLGDYTVINTEWGDFASCASMVGILPRTKYDVAVDSLSPNKGQQLFEKMISGYYLGELTRQIINDFINGGHLFAGETNELLSTPWSLSTEVMSTIEGDNSENLQIARMTIESKMGAKSPLLMDCIVVQDICHFVSLRAARLAAAGVAAVTGHVKREMDATIAVDGSLFTKYYRFERRMVDTLVELFSEGDANISFEHSEDGSGIGAALAAAIVKIDP